VLSKVYQWISALKSVDCRRQYRRVCLRNQMALDLLKQMRGFPTTGGVEWPFSQGQAARRI
jgi:hypothetical protein